MLIVLTILSFVVGGAALVLLLVDKYGKQPKEQKAKVD